MVELFLITMANEVRGNKMVIGILILNMQLQRGVKGGKLGLEVELDSL